MLPNQLLRFTGKDIQNISFDAWLEKKPEILRPIASKWFTVIANCGGDVQSIFHDGYPMGCVDNAAFAYVNVFTAHVNVGFFYGAALPDKAKLLEGNGKRMRHIKLKPGTKYNEEAIASLIHASYVDIKQRLKDDSLGLKE